MHILVITSIRTDSQIRSRLSSENIHSVYLRKKKLGKCRIITYLFSELIVFWLEAFAVTAPWGIELDKHITLRIIDKLFKVLGYGHLKAREILLAIFIPRILESIMRLENVRITPKDEALQSRPESAGDNSSANGSNGSHSLAGRRFSEKTPMRGPKTLFTIFPFLNRGDLAVHIQTLLQPAKHWQKPYEPFTLTALLELSGTGSDFRNGSRLPAA